MNTYFLQVVVKSAFQGIMDVLSLDIMMFVLLLIYAWLPEAGDPNLSRTTKATGQPRRGFPFLIISIMIPDSAPRGQKDTP